jgi:hypothetical protein
MVANENDGKKVYEVIMCFEVTETRYIYASNEAEAIKRAEKGDDDDYAGDNQFEGFISADIETLKLNKEKTQERNESIAASKKQQEIENNIKVGDTVLQRKNGQKFERRVSEVCAFCCPTGAHSIKVDGDNEEIKPWEWEAKMPKEAV